MSEREIIAWAIALVLAAIAFAMGLGWDREERKAWKREMLISDLSAQLRGAQLSYQIVTTQLNDLRQPRNKLGQYCKRVG